MDNRNKNHGHCLTPAALEHIKHSRHDSAVMRDLLSRRVDVFIVRNRDNSPGVHQYAIVPKENTSFYIDCCETACLAVDRAISLGLRVVLGQGSQL